MGSISLSRVCHPSTLRMVIWPDASSAQRSMGTVSAQGSKREVAARLWDLIAPRMVKS